MLPSALGSIVDPHAGEPRVALCPLPMDLGDGYVSTSKTIIDGTVKAWASNVTRTAEVLGRGSGPVPVALGEFGLNTDAAGAEEYVKLVHETADAHGFGVAYWSRDNGSWGPYGDDGSARNLVSWLQRYYPLAAEGLVAWSSADSEALSVTIVGGGAAEIYVPPLLTSGVLNWQFP